VDAAARRERGRARAAGHLRLDRARSPPRPAGRSWTRLRRRFGRRSRRRWSGSVGSDEWWPSAGRDRRAPGRVRLRTPSCQAGSLVAVILGGRRISGCTPPSPA
jgi:hypothetical protein